jgi:hypothetical protein
MLQYDEEVRGRVRVRVKGAIWMLQYDEEVRGQG